MTSAPALTNPRRIPAQDPVPALLRDLVHERTGVFFEDGRLAAMLDKLEERALARRCQSFLDYYYILKYDVQGDEEWRRALDAFSVPETYFWREPDQIKVLVERVVPAWFRQNSDPLRIWSAACATGEEPYSIAIALREAGWGRHPIEILASDASEAALARMRAGVYRERSFRALPAELRGRYFDAVPEGLRLHPDVARQVEIRWINLMQTGDFPAAATRHVIFCRNVFIYFSPRTIARTVAAFARCLTPGGTLFVGASESLLKLTNQFDLREMGSAFGYVRNPA